MKVKLTNAHNEFILLPVATHDRSKGLRYEKLQPKESVVLDERDLTDVARKLVKKQKLKSEQLADPPVEKPAEAKKVKKGKPKAPEPATQETLDPSTDLV